MQFSSGECVQTLHSFPPKMPVETHDIDKIRVRWVLTDPNSQKVKYISPFFHRLSAQKDICHFVRLNNTTSLRRCLITERWVCACADASYIQGLLHTAHALLLNAGAAQFLFTHAHTRKQGTVKLHNSLVETSTVLAGRKLSTLSRNLALCDGLRVAGTCVSRPCWRTVADKK